MAIIEKFEFKIPTENKFKTNTVYNIRDISTPVGVPDVDYQSSNPPRFFLYLVSTFNVPLSTLNTLDGFIDGSEGSLVPIEDYEQPEIYLANGDMANQIGFSIIVNGYGTSSTSDTTNNSITVPIGSNAVNLSGFVIVYDMEPGSTSSIKHVLAACRSPQPFSVSGNLTISFNEKNLWTESETVCQG